MIPSQCNAEGGFPVCFSSSSPKIPQAPKSPATAAYTSRTPPIGSPTQGPGSTFLTGKSGIADYQLNLGKNTLLGQ